MKNSLTHYLGQITEKQIVYDSVLRVQYFIILFRHCSPLTGFQF